MLLKQLEGGLVIDVVAEDLHEVVGIKSMQIKLKISEGDVETAAYGLIFMIATLSFSDALPAGMSKKDFQYQYRFQYQYQFQQVCNLIELVVLQYLGQVFPRVLQ